MSTVGNRENYRCYSGLPGISNGVCPVKQARMEFSVGTANNVRDVIRFLRSTEIVQPIKVIKKAHLHYELTEQGKHFQRLLRQAELGS